MLIISTGSHAHWPDRRAADAGSSGLADPAGDEAGRKELNPKATAAALFVRRLFLRRNGGRKVKTSPETERKTG